jgi:hypothetical protein
MLSVLEEKVGEAHGLAIAAAVTVGKVERQVVDPALLRELEAMRLDANETRARCLEVERSLGAETAAEILAHANAINEKASDLAAAWLKAGTGPLAAWSFLAMGEAAEVTVWIALASLARRDGEGPVADLAAWGLPVQERHLAVTLKGAARLASSFDPAAPRWG